MTKLRLILVGACALAAFFAFSGTASALTDIACDGNPYNNDPLVRDFQLNTSDSQKQRVVSGVTGQGIVCGTDLQLQWPGCKNDQTLYNHATLDVPPGVVVADTDGHEGQWAGSAQARMIFCVPIVGPVRFPDKDSDPWGMDSNVRVNLQGKQKCIDENNALVGGPAPGDTLVACYHGTNSLGENWNWVTSNDNPPIGTPSPNDEFWMTIGPMHAIGDITQPGLSGVQMSLCSNFGPLGGPCGSYDPNTNWVQQNGYASVLNCPGGRGVYTIGATRNDGLVTPDASVCVKWSATGAQRLGG